jgi:hypothetical protein
MKRIALGIPLLLLFAVLPAQGQVHYHDDGAPWKHATKKGPDAVVGGWYYNLGITGLRAILLKDRPAHLGVKYVFEGTPAHGKVKVDDIIIGANGKKFVVPHRNGYSVEVFGGHGPMTDFAAALDESQGDRLKGRLTLEVERNGQPVQVTLDVGTKYGSYGKTFPIDCRKSDLILKELYAYIAKAQGDDGSWGGPPHDTFAPLALLASGNKAYLPLVKKNVQMHAKTTQARDAAEGLVNWRYMSAAVVMSEYYLATGEKWVLPELQEVYDFLMTSQYTDISQIVKSPTHDQPKDNKRAIGGWGHNPGFEGYGPIAMLTGQGALSLAMMHRCGIKVDRTRHEMAYDFLARGTGKNGYVWYADIPSSPDGWADMGRTGAAALANFLSPYEDRRFKMQAMAHARVIGEHPETLPDTHGSPIMGMGYAALGASIDPESFRKMMDNNRWWFTLAQCADGTFYFQPNRDYNAGDFTSGASRISASAVVALIFSAKEKNLYLTGAHRK